MNIEIGDEIKVKYLANPNTCPFCDNGQVEADNVEFTDIDIITQNVKCPKCEMTWKDKYHLQDIVDAEINTEYPESPLD